MAQIKMFTILLTFIRKYNNIFSEQYILSSFVYEERLVVELVVISNERDKKKGLIIPC